MADTKWTAGGFSIDLREKRIAAERTTAHALLVVAVGALVLGLFALSSQWERVTAPDTEQAAINRVR